MNYVITALSDKFFDSFVGAFVGAFFAFIFVRFAEMGKALYDRQVKNFNTLVELEYVLLMLIDEISNNIYSIDQSLELEKQLSGEDPIVSYNKMLPLAFNRSLILSLTNLTYINNLTELGTDLSRINQTIDAFNESYAELRSAVLSKQITHQTYVNNFKIHSESLRILKKFLHNAESKVKRLVAINRELTVPPFFSRFIIRFTKTKFPLKHQIEAGVSKLNQELADGLEKSEKEIKSKDKGSNLQFSNILAS